LLPEIICADAVAWMADHKAVGAVITSPPDAEEIGRSVDNWEPWFCAAVTAALATSDGLAIFYVTDRRNGGRLISKAAICHARAAAAGFDCLWHKIALRRGVGGVDIHRPGYSHLVAFGKGRKPGAATPDVFERGNTLYPNGTGLVAARVACVFAKESSKVVVDPFCGRGTIPAVAAALGLRAMGVDLDPKQCEIARGLRLKLTA
jgi:hypothetical protein